MKTPSRFFLADRQDSLQKIRTAQSSCKVLIYWGKLNVAFYQWWKGMLSWDALFIRTCMGKYLSQVQAILMAYSSSLGEVKDLPKVIGVIPENSGSSCIACLHGKHEDYFGHQNVGSYWKCNAMHGWHWLPLSAGSVSSRFTSICVIRVCLDANYMIHSKWIEKSACHCWHRHIILW